MSISTIDLRGKGGTYGLQVRVRRGKAKPLTKFFAFKKHGGFDKTWALARQTDARMKDSLRGDLSFRRKHKHANTPNANSTSGIAGIRAFKDAEGVMHFSACWRTGKPKKRKNAVVQRSSKTHGILGALGQVLDARAAGTGQEMPSAQQAWKIIKRHQGL